MATFPLPVHELLASVRILPLPSVCDPGVPVDLRLSHEQADFDALGKVRELGKYALDILSVSLPGVGLDPVRNALAVDLNQIDLGQVASGVELSLGELRVSGLASEVDLSAASRSVAEDVAFATSLADPSLAGARSIRTRAEPAVGA